MKPHFLVLFVLVIVFGVTFVAFSGGGSEPAPGPRQQVAEGALADGDAPSVASADAERGAAPPAEVPGAGAMERTEVAGGPGRAPAVRVVSGRIVDAEGEPRAAVQLRVNAWRLGGVIDIAGAPPGAATELAEAVTDERGRFSFEVDGARAGSLSLAADDLVFAARARFEEKGADQDLGDLVVVAAASIAGVVRDERGAPVAGTTVAAELGPMGFGATSKMTTGDDGAFVVGKLRPGRWTLRATNSAFLPASVARDVRAGERVQDVVITLAPGASVVGQVVDERGVGVAGMKVTSQRKERSGELEIVRFSDEEAVVTDASGGFRIGGLEGGTITLKAYGDGHTTAVQAVDGDARGVRLEVQRLGSIAGVLVDERGAPIAESRVHAYAEKERGGVASMVEGLAGLELNRSDRASSRTDERGAFVIDGVRPGYVRIEAKGAAHLPAQQRGLRVQPAERLEGVRLVAAAGAVARVEVVDERGDPVPKAKVEISRAPAQIAPGMRMEARIEGDGPGGFVIGDRRVLGSAETDEGGVATILGLPAADAVVHATHDAYAPSERQRMTLPASGTVTHRVLVQEPGYLEVQVKDASGGPAAGTDVVLGRAGESESQDRAKADALGRVRFGPLRAGAYTATLARAPQARRAGDMVMFLGGGDERIAASAREVAVAAGQTAQVELLMPVLTQLTGRVEGVDGPMSGVVVELESVGDGDEALGFGGRQETSDGDGRVTFADVEAGRYEVRYGKRGQVVKAQLDLEVPPNTAAMHTDLPLRTGEVRLVVISKEDAEPVANAEVRLTQQDASRAQGDKPRKRSVMMVSMTTDGAGESSSTMTFGTPRVVTDEGGVASFEDVPVGAYTLEVESARYAPFERPDVVVVERQRTDCGVVEVSPAGQVRGTVTDEAGERVMAVVQCRQQGRTEWGTTEMAMQGGYRLRGLAPGSYEVRAQPVGPRAGAPAAPVVVEVVAGKTQVLDLKVKN